MGEALKIWENIRKLNVEMREMVKYGISIQYNIILLLLRWHFNITEDAWNVKGKHNIKLFMFYIAVK